MARKYNLDKVSNYLFNGNKIICRRMSQSIRCSRRTILSKYPTTEKDELAQKSQKRVKF